MCNVVVTGGSTGIGAAIVLAFAKAGHRVLLTYFTGLRRAQQLRAKYPDLISIAYLDQGDIDSVAAFAAAVSHWSDARGVDVLVNNAALGSSTVHKYVRRKLSGAMPPGDEQPAHEHDHEHDHEHEHDHGRDHDHEYVNGRHASTNGHADEHTNGHAHKQTNGHAAAESETSSSCSAASSAEDGPNAAAMETGDDERRGWSSASECAERTMRRALADEALMKVNSLGPLWVTDSLAGEIEKVAYRDGGSRATVIFIGSVGGGSAAVFPEYCAADAMSKAATTYLSKHLAAKYVQTPVDVMCISPGATETDMFRASTLSKVSDPQRFIDGMPKRKLIDPNDIAASVLWLSTQCPSGLFHGANLDASMGLSVRPGLQTETEHSR